MAMRPAQPGDVLLVVHEFTARSPDELSLAKGDRIELIERDDDFGDGWFLGKHIQNGSTGLFPEVYTTPAPRATLAPAATQNNTQTRQPLNAPPVFSKDGPASVGAASTMAGTSFKTGRTPEIPPNVGMFGPGYTSPPISPQSSQLPVNQFSAFKSPNVPAGYTRPSGHNSAVIDETMNVIDEHITSMHKPSLAVVGSVDRRPSNDSGSQYSGGFGRGSSYTNGEESNEEEIGLTREEVMSWSPTKVAQYLEKAGVERSHCDVFQEEEFSGEVLLGLDQSAILLQELKLGSIGRRMKTWAKIRALQEEVKAAQAVQRQPGPGFRGSSARLSNVERQSIPDSPVVAPTTSVVDSIVNKLQSQPSYRSDSIVQPNIASPALPSPGLPSPGVPSPGIPPQSMAQHSSRPSAASVRGIAHSRQSSIDQGRGSFAKGYASPPHMKQASLDRAWTMEPAMNKQMAAPERSWTVPSKPTPSATSSRPASSVNLHAMNPDRSFDKRGSTIASRDDGYVSGSDLEMQRQRQLLSRNDSSEYGKISSPTADQKRSSGLFWKGSRPPSPEKRPESGAMTRIVSEPSTNMISPTVTKLAYDTETPRASKALVNQATTGEVPPPDPVPSSIMDLRKGLRNISNALTGRESGTAQSPVDKTGLNDASVQDTSTLGGSSSPSINSKSMDFDDANKSELSTPVSAQNAAAAKRKTKKTTSAYTRGLQRKSPNEQIPGCDHSGWMNKKSSSLVGTWKPRLFVLRGRRLSYYYSENDAEERGVIDISNHRVVAVDNDLFTGIASLTGANSTNVSPQNGSPVSTFSPKSAATTPGSMSAESPGSNSVNRGAPLKGDAQLFIFKLVPPRAGLSKGVNFTKPTVHYFAVPSLAEGRYWMGALMKATIDRDESKSVITTYQQKTISLEKARARKERPPELKEVDQSVPPDNEEETVAGTREMPNTEHLDDQISRPSYEGESFTSSRPISTESPALSAQVEDAANAQKPSEETHRTNRLGRGWSLKSTNSRSNGRAGQQGEGLGIRGMNDGDDTVRGLPEAGTW